MTAASDILIAATDVDDRLLECFFKVIVIDLNFDDVRMFDLLPRR